MRWTLIFAILIVAVFVVTYKATADIWTATNGAGIIVVIFLIGAAFRFTRIFDRRWEKITAATISALMIAALVAHWIVMWRTTEWQYDQLQAIRRVIYNGVAMSTLGRPALDTYREFRASPPGMTIGKAYRRLYPPGISFADSTILRDDGPFFESVSDSVVELTGESSFVPGFDSAFVNHDGRHGLAQIAILVRKNGASYDIQN